MTRSLLRTVLIATGLLTGLCGCSGGGYYSEVPEPEGDPATEYAQEPEQTQGGYRVKAGDTLYSIAFSSGKDWRDLAAANAIQAPFTIYPGQVLNLGGAVVQKRAPAVVAAPAPAPIRAEPVAKPASAAAAAPVIVASKPVVPAEPRQPPPKPGAWQWPASGKLIRTYAAGAQPHKGVDLAGNAGDPVHAANSGTVVYAGDGVRGYGNLLILKHDAQYLSAYAHNRRLLVKEGDVVRGGQRIAEIGDSGTDRVKLHFEVRKQGNPVDPLKILPRR